VSEDLPRAWIRACGKFGYENRRLARKARARTRKGRPSEKSRELGGGGLSVYLCPTCHHWHVGHLPYVIRRGERSRAEMYGRWENDDE
jgi:hypothetical protein